MHLNDAQLMCVVFLFFFFLSFFHLSWILHYGYLLYFLFFLVNLCEKDWNFRWLINNSCSKLLYLITLHMYRLVNWNAHNHASSKHYTLTTSDLKYNIIQCIGVKNKYFIQFRMQIFFLICILPHHNSLERIFIMTVDKKALHNI